MARLWYFEVLEVNEDASKDEIMQSFRRKASMYHPDKNSSPFANERMQELNAAKDKALKALIYSGSPSGSPETRETRDRPRASENPRNTNHSSQAQKGEDIQRSVNVSLREAYFGCSKSVAVRRSLVDVTIPPGASYGTVVQVPNAGRAGS